jgi:hypothetical protein
MTPANHYRVKAGDLAALSKAETDPFGKAEYQRLSQAYLRLAEQADRNSRYIATAQPGTGAPAQQQQQPQPTPERGIDGQQPQTGHDVYPEESAPAQGSESPKGPDNSSG